MCGIAGIIARETLRPDQLGPLRQMSDMLVHRGPDGGAGFTAPHVALAVRRLSIIDLPTGWQPLTNEDESLVLIANGEIYNYLELRDQLRARGHVFRTNGDCETIVHLYEERGEECVHQLRGMFAFALWDVRARKLFLARDRMGEKPLYLHERDGRVVFGSELKTLLHSGLVPTALDPRAVDLYFHFQYVPEPLTPVCEIRKLPAGHTLAVSVEPWSIRENCYWQMEDAPAIDGDPARVIREELESASELTIRSDVPVGIALSGGLDSSAIAALATKRYPGTMHAFSAGYVGRPHSDEREDARTLARHLGMPFHEVEIGVDEIVEEFPRLVYWQDDPIADMAGRAYYAISRAARDCGIPVLLQGQGGDELFWGYDWVVDAIRQSKRKSGRAAVTDYITVEWPKWWPRRAPLLWLMSAGGLRTSLREYRRDRTSPPDQLVFLDVTADFQAASRSVPDLYPRRFKESMGGARAADLFTVPLPWPQIEILMTRLICQTYLLENGIAQGDRLSMANSVELRLPLVDFRLVEKVIGLRKGCSDLRLPRKAWFREAVRDLLPPWVLARPKRGFQPPVRAWHRALFARHGGALADGYLVEHGVLEPAAARRLAEGPFPIDANAPLSFKALVLELWCRQMLSGPLEHVAEPPAEDRLRELRVDQRAPT
jgi:asparagine synthase (glutamine-hydrolysing)